MSPGTTVAGVARPLLLLALFGALYLVGLGDVGLFDYDEACYAEVARQMTLEQDYLNPRLNGEPFYEKPPLLYWSQVLGYRIFGVGEIGARFFTATAALALILATYFFTRRPLGPSGAFLAACMLGCCAEFPGLARIAFTDMLLTLWLMLVLFLLHRAFERMEAGGGRGWFLWACFFSGLATLTKGAIGVVLPGAAAVLFLIWRRRILRVLRLTWLVPGALIMLGVGLSWYLALGLTHDEGFTFMKTLFLEQHVGRFSRVLQGHQGPFFYYVLVLLAGFLPWSPFVILALRRGDLGDAGDERVRFLRLLLVFATVTFVFFSIAATKLPNYIAPMLPCLAILTANLWERESRRPSPWSAGWSCCTALATGALFLLALVAFALPAILDRLPDLMGDKLRKHPALLEPVALGPWPYVCGALLLAAGGGAAWAWKKRRLFVVVGALGVGFAAFHVVLIAGLLPRYDAHFRKPLRDLAQRAASQVPEGKRIALIGIRHAPSVAFYGKRQTRYVGKSRAEAIDALFRGPDAAIGITVEAYLPNVTSRGPAEVIERLRGYVLVRFPPALKRE